MSRNNFYKNRTEPDLRYELDAMFRGEFPEVPKGQTFVLRKMRRDNVGNLVQCQCVDLVTHEPDKDTFCPFCQGEGYLWDESFIEGFRKVVSTRTGYSTSERQIPTGLVQVPMIDLYTRYTLPITTKDRIVELILDVDGNPILPYRRKELYIINIALDYHSDYGRLEYWRLSCYAEKRKFLNGVEG